MYDYICMIIYVWMFMRGKVIHTIAPSCSCFNKRPTSLHLLLHDGAEDGGRWQQQSHAHEQREAVHDGTSQGFRPEDGHTCATVNPGGTCSRGPWYPMTSGIGDDFSDVGSVGG